MRKVVLDFQYLRWSSPADTGVRRLEAGVHGDGPQRAT